MIYLYAIASTTLWKGAIMTYLIDDSISSKKPLMKSRKSRLTKVIVSITVLCILLSVLFACSNKPSLNGSYRHEATTYSATYTFTSDGKVTLELDDNSGKPRSGSGTYSITGDEITLTFDGTDHTTSFEQKDNSVVIDGIEYIKV